MAGRIHSTRKVRWLLGVASRMSRSSARTGMSICAPVLFCLSERMPSRMCWRPIRTTSPRRWPVNKSSARANRARTPNGMRGLKLGNIHISPGDESTRVLDARRLIAASRIDLDEPLGHRKRHQPRMAFNIFRCGYGRSDPSNCATCLASIMARRFSPWAVRKRSSSWRRKTCVIGASPSMKAFDCK